MKSETAIKKSMKSNSLDIFSNCQKLHSDSKKSSNEPANPTSKLAYKNPTTNLAQINPTPNLDKINPISNLFQLNQSLN